MDTQTQKAFETTIKAMEKLDERIENIWNFLKWKFNLSHQELEELENGNS